MKAQRIELDLAAFNDSFFAEYEQELASQGAEQKLMTAFEGSVLVQSEMNVSRTYAQLVSESKSYYNRTDVTKFELSLGSVMVSSAVQCAAHQHEMTVSNNAVNTLDATHTSLSDDHDGHKHNAEKKHNSKLCENCRSGKTCSKR